ncbi:hypothetical protein [Ekhidna sp.]
MTEPLPLLKLYCSIFSIILSIACFSQYTEAEVIDVIQSYQVEDDEFYDPGLFPVKRKWSFSSNYVDDNSIFFTASINSTLRMLNDKLDDRSREIVASILKETNPVYGKYRNRNGGITYNFWQTVSPDLPFPNGNKLISNKKSRLPDDFDTTVLIALSRGKNKRYDSLFRKQMVAYASRTDRANVKLITPDEYLNSKAYETWFGKNMPQTFDLCIMSNVLLYVIERDFEWNEYDEATASLIKEMVLNNDHLERTANISHHSDSPALVLYHIARLIAADTDNRFDSIKEKVQNDLIDLLNERNNEVEKVMILSSLHRLGYETNDTIDLKRWQKQMRSFSFFSINPFNISKGRSRYIPSITWVSEPYNWTLLLELMVLQKQQG